MTTTATATTTRYPHYPVPTEYTLRLCQRKSEAQRKNYTIENFWEMPGMYDVTHKQDKSRSYMVDTDLQECNCPQFPIDGMCKHYQMVQDQLAEDAAIDAQATEHAERLEARHNAVSEWEAENL